MYPANAFTECQLCRLSVRIGVACLQLENITISLYWVFFYFEENLAGFTSDIFIFFTGIR